MNSVVVKIDGDDSGFRKSISGIGDIAQKGLGTVIKGITAASAATTGLTAGAVRSYAEYEQLIGGVDTLFEESSARVCENAERAFKTAGLSANEYMQTVTGFAAALKQSFGDTGTDLEAAAVAADRAVIDMADNANKMGTSMELIQNAYQGFAKQNYTMLDNLKLGYGGTKEEMERLIEDASRLSGTKYNIKNLADLYEAIHVIQENIGITGTTAKEAEETISGSVNTMKAAWKNLAVGMADSNADVGALTEKLTESIEMVGKNLLPVIKTALSGVGSFISKAAEDIIPSLTNALLAYLPELLNTGVKVINALLDGMLKNKGRIASAAVEVTGLIINALKTLAPELVRVMGEVLAAAAEAIGNAVPILKPFTEIIEIIGEKIKDLLPVLEGVIAGVLAFKTAMSVKAVIDGVTASMKALNLVLASNPLAAAVSVTIAAGAALVSFCGNIEKTKSEAALLAENVHQLTETVTEAKEEFDGVEQSIRANISAELGGIEHTALLAEELRGLADASGVVVDADRERASFILNEINEALGTEYAMIGNQIQGYERLAENIDLLINKKRAMIILNQQEEGYNYAVSNLSDEEKRYSEMSRMLDNALRLKANYEEMEHLVGQDYADYLTLIENTIPELESALNESEGLIKGYYEAIEGYETDYSLLMSDNSEEIKQIYERNSMNLQQWTGDNRQVLEEQVLNTSAALGRALEAVRGGTANLEDAWVQAAVRNYSRAYAEWEKSGGGSVDGMIAGIENGIPVLYKTLSSLEAETESAGIYFSSGYAQGIAAGMQEAEAKAGELGGGACAALQNAQQSNSPSKVTHGLGVDFSAGFAVGIKAGEASVINAAVAVARAGIKAAEDELGIHSPSRVARDRIGKMLTKGIAVGIVEGGDEVSEAFERLLDDLNLQRDFGVVSESEYYRELYRLREEYLEEGSKSWWEYTKKILQYSNTLKEEFSDNADELKDRAVKAYDELAEEAEKKIGKVLDKQAKFQKQLESMSELITQSTETDDWGNERPVFSLTDWEKENAELRAYNKTLENVSTRLKKAFGDDTAGYSELMQVIRDGGLEDGLRLATEIIFADDDTLKKYIDGRRENKRLAEGIASEHYAEEKQLITDDINKSMGDLQTVFKAEFEALPEEFFAPLGEASAGEFGQAFMAELDEILENAETEMSLAVERAVAVANEGSKNESVTYNNTYILQPSDGESTHSQLKSIRDEETLKRMRG